MSILVVGVAFLGLTVTVDLSIRFRDMSATIGANLDVHEADFTCCVVFGVPWETVAEVV